MTRLFATMLLLAFAGTAWAAGPPDAAAWKRFGDIEETERLDRRGEALYQVEKLGEATALLERIVKLRVPQGKLSAGAPRPRPEPEQPGVPVPATG